MIGVKTEVNTGVKTCVHGDVSELSWVSFNSEHLSIHGDDVMMFFFQQHVQRELVMEMVIVWWTRQAAGASDVIVSWAGLEMIAKLVWITYFISGRRWISI